jgi:hypothetical protein
VVGGIMNTVSSESCVTIERFTSSISVEESGGISDAHQDADCVSASCDIFENIQVRDNDFPSAISSTTMKNRIIEIILLADMECIETDDKKTSFFFSKA